jgi:hypothetical protein
MKLIAVSLAVLAAAVAGVVGSAGGATSGPVGWSGKADVFRHPTLPRDRVLTGMLRNEGDRGLRIDLGDVRLVTEDGSRVPAAPVFLQTFGHGLWAAGRGPQVWPDSELQRTGRIARLEPGDEVPLTVSWHAADGEPDRIEYGAGSLQVPG